MSPEPARVAGNTTERTQPMTTPADATRDEALVEAVARAICAAFGDDWVREGAQGLMPAYAPFARAAIAAVRDHDVIAPRETWQPIETAPKDDAPVDLWDGQRRWTRMFWISTSPQHPKGSWGKEPTDWYDAFDPKFFSHWMPLPAPPLAPHEAETAGGEGGQ